MIIDNNVIKASEGKIFRRKEDKQIYGNKINLGYTYYIGGVKLKQPHLDVPEDFEEINAYIKLEAKNVRGVKK